MLTTSNQIFGSLMRYSNRNHFKKKYQNSSVEDSMYFLCYILRYYKSDEDVIYDDELQGFVNELSAAGSVKNGGGMVRY